jgi:hypothetical protein
MSSRQILNPPALIVTSRAIDRRIRKKPEAASRIGDNGRASRHGRARQQLPFERPARRAAARNVAAGHQNVRASRSKDGEHLRHEGGGWLKSASMTPTTSAVAAANPATTAVPNPSFPDR